MINICLTDIRKDFKGTDQEFTQKVEAPESMEGLAGILKEGLRAAYERQILDAV